MIELLKILTLVVIATFTFLFLIKDMENKEKLLVLLFFNIIIFMIITIRLIGFDIGQYIIIYFVVPLIYIFALYLLIKKDVITIEFIFLITISQNIFLTVASSYISKQLFSNLMMLKEIYIILLVLISIIKFILKNNLSINQMMINTNKIDRISVLIAVTLILYTGAYGAPSLNTRLISARQIAIPVLFYFLGRSINLDKNNLIKYFDFIKIFSILITIFGIFELIIGDSFWTNIGISKFIEYKGMEEWTNSLTGLPGNFYSYDFYNQIGCGIRRMVSFIMEPTTLAQLIAASMMYTYWIKTDRESIVKKNIYTIILGIGLILTIGKGGILVCIVCTMYCMKYIKKYKLTSKLTKNLTIAGAIVVIAYSFKNETSVSFHLQGLIENFMSVIRYPIGRGIGMSGNFANLYATGNYDLGHGESYIGVIIGQFGLIGIILFGLFYIYMYIELYKVIKYNEDLSSIATVCLGLLSGCLLASFLSESAISFISTILIIPIIGIVINLDMKKQIDTIL